MHEIICPHCNKAFTIDEAGFADIVRQVRTAEFDRELHERLAQFERDKKNEVKLAEVEARNEMKSELAKRDTELAKLQTGREADIARLKAENQSALMALKSEVSERVAELKSTKDSEIAQLQATIQNAENEKKLAVAEAVVAMERSRDKLAGQLEAKDNEAKLAEANLIRTYEDRLRTKDEMIERYKDMKVRLSTKMLGETLEQHCEVAFNQIRATAFPRAYFEKDSEVADGTKGDYIFRESDEDGNEIISIMFEMKNEADATEKRRKNEDHFAKLDKDRLAKKCEYAVLVSLLEGESELYNQGIVDVSYRHQKMYVVRPQFFIPIITVLRNAALKTLDQKKELAHIRSQNIDVSTFEDDMNAWKLGWATTMKNAGKKHLEAIEQINKAIKDLEKTRDALMLSDKHLLAAENKMDDLTIKRLTRNNPTMAAKFAERRKDT